MSVKQQAALTDCLTAFKIGDVVPVAEIHHGSEIGMTSQFHHLARFVFDELDEHGARECR
jgi:hypothetical protein